MSVRITVQKGTLGGKGTLTKNTAAIFFDKKVDEVVVSGAGRHIYVKVGDTLLNRRTLQMCVRKAVVKGKEHKISHIMLSFDDLLERCTDVSLNDAAELLVTNMFLASFEFRKYKTSNNEHGIKLVTIFSKSPASIKGAVSRAIVVGEEVNKCRTLANTPGGEMTPILLAKAAQKAFLGAQVRVALLRKAHIKSLKMGGILGVAQGSKEPPIFIVLEYKGARNKKEQPVLLIGKGVTFDTGGLNLKPSNAINDMHLDMSGGAAVIHTISACARLGIKKNIVGLVPAVENMPSGSSYRPGDILRSMSGKTIEVLNTDAEGRIILADALTYAARFKPAIVIDVATLTGAAMSALGQRASAIFTKNKKLSDDFVACGEETGDYVWPLPLWDEYREEIKGTFGDIANIGKTSYGGAITGAIFLYEFAKGFPEWVHIDMAPRMTAIPDEYLSKGAIGVPVRLLVRFIERYEFQK